MVFPHTIPSNNTLTKDENDILNELDEKNTHLELDKEAQVRSEISKFSSSIYLMKLKEKKDESAIHELKPFLSKTVKSELQTWLQFEEKNKPELQKFLQAKDEFELKSIGRELGVVQKFLSRKDPRPQTAQAFVRTHKNGLLPRGNPENSTSSCFQNKENDFQINRLRQIGKVRPITAFPSNSVERRNEFHLMRKRILSGQLDEPVNRLPALDKGRSRRHASTHKTRSRRITSAMPSSKRGRFHSSLKQNARSKVQSSKGFTLQEIRQFGREASIQEKKCRLTSGVLTRKSLLDQKLGQFNNRVMSGYYQKTFKDANSTKAASRKSFPKPSGFGQKAPGKKFDYRSAIEKFEQRAKVLNKLIEH